MVEEQTQEICPGPGWAESVPPIDPLRLGPSKLLLWDSQVRVQNRVNTKESQLPSPPGTFKSPELEKLC